MWPYAAGRRITSPLVSADHRLVPGVLITGAMGLVGAKLAVRACDEGWSITALDLRAPAQRGDVRNAHCIARAVIGCVGIVHLAAVSRVIWGEQDPALCIRCHLAR